MGCPILVFVWIRKKENYADTRKSSIRKTQNGSINR